MPNINLSPSRTALILIDLQQGIVSAAVAPRTGAEVLANAVRLAGCCRELGALVVLVHVVFSSDGKDRLAPPTDVPPFSRTPTPGWADIVPQLGPEPTDLVIAKRQWGAFYGTDLDLQLRRRGIDTIVMGGIATNMGVESTARDAYERGYAQIFADDAMASLTTEAHQFAISTILPRIGRVRSTEDILTALRAA